MPLFSQPASFWLGAFMVAEAPLVLVASVLSPATRARILEGLLSGPLALGAAAVAAGALGLIVGWLAHRLGFGH